MVVLRCINKFPRRNKFEFSFVRNGHQTSQKSGTCWENKTLPILQICPYPSQTIGDIYNLEFSLVGKSRTVGKQ